MSAQEVLFPELNKARYGDQRLHRNLFLPRLLESETAKYTPLLDEKQDAAYNIVLKWAELESSGKITKKKETTLEGEFVNEIFGKALGYTLFSEGAETWNVEPKYSINGAEADVALGEFHQSTKSNPQVVVELKGPKTNLDRDRFNGRTAVQQCWDYLDLLPECQWGIVCNFVSIRLYHRNHTPRSYQLFTLQDLRDKKVFARFYYLFQKGGLLSDFIGDIVRAEKLLNLTNERQREVGDDLYDSYSHNRAELIEHLIRKPLNITPDKAIHISQKLLDRIIFVAFCEDRDLLPDNIIKKAYLELPPFSRVTNPRWRNFLDLFSSIDKGNTFKKISAYNGGLFRQDDEVDNLQLDDKWTDFFYNIGKYDFRDEVNVDVLGHLFEKSINEIEKYRKSGFFEITSEDNSKSKMKKSAERKRFGIYYTPPDFTNFITRNTIGKLAKNRQAKIADQLDINIGKINEIKSNKKGIKYWEKCLEELRSIKVIDPACGSGAFLISAYDLFVDVYKEAIENLSYYKKESPDELLDQISDFILTDNLFGVDLSPQSVEITQLALWIRSAQKGKSLADLSKNIVCGNSLISDSDVNSLAMQWEDTFPEIFSRKNRGFDCVIGNPPWERMKLQEREFFDLASPEIASAVNASARKIMIQKLKNENPKLYNKYVEAKESAEANLDYIRKSGRYPLTGRGDINTYAIFAELAMNIVSPEGMVGILVPSGIATEHTTRYFFGNLIKSDLLNCIYDFENMAPVFPDVHRSYKFSIFIFCGSNIATKQIDFVFFAHRINELLDKTRHISLNSKDFRLLNPNTQTCPIFRTQRDAEITKAIYKRVPILIDKNRKEGGNPWGIKFFRMFDQTNDASLFVTADELKSKKYKRQGANWIKGKKTYLPLYEAKMFRPYDHRFGSTYIKDENWINQGQTFESSLVEHQNPEYVVTPRWWANEAEILRRISHRDLKVLICYRNITRATDSRTMLATFIPLSGVINSAPIILCDEKLTVIEQACLLANLNSFVLDFITRQKIGNVNLNFFIVEQLPVFTPDTYSKKCPWNKSQSLKKWISDRVLKLSCTGNDMIPLAEAAGFKPKVHKWNPDERARIKAELDAAYFLLYGINRDDAEYILSTFSGTQAEGENMFGLLTINDRILKQYDLLKKSM